MVVMTLSGGREGHGKERALSLGEEEACRGDWTRTERVWGPSSERYTEGEPPQKKTPPLSPTLSTPSATTTEKSFATPLPFLPFPEEVPGTAAQAWKSPEEQRPSLEKMGSLSAKLLRSACEASPSLPASSTVTPPRVPAQDGGRFPRC